MSGKPDFRSSVVEGQPEQSMDEILASIRQIIADDSGPKPAKAERQGLAVPTEVSNSNATSAAPAGAPPVRTSDASPIPSARPTLGEPTARPTVVIPQAAPPEDFEAEIAAGMAKALAVETAMPTATQKPVLEQSFAVPTLASEDVARDVVERWIGTHNDEMTRQVEAVVAPVVRAWLAENLPSLVERLIREEIEAVSRGTAR